MSVNIMGMTLPTPDLPRMARVRQEFDPSELADVPAAIAATIAACPGRQRIAPGSSVAVAVGSRGIDRLDVIVKAVVDALLGLGARPYLVPAMGSHGGATADGQRAMLAGYGVTEERMGVPVRAGMDVVETGRMADGTRLWTDALALEADAIVPIGRVKPHTDFKGRYESGLVKMMCIGLGNQRGAESLHQLDLPNFATVLPAAAAILLRRLPIAFGLAVIENAYDRACHVEAVAADAILDREPALLEVSKQRMGSILLSGLHLLVIDEIGKDVSGAGMDSNITGRPTALSDGFPTPPAQRIAVLGLTERTHGNATGMGMADVTTQQLVESIDFTATSINGITSRAPQGSRIPLVGATAADAVRIGLASSLLAPGEPPRIVRIATTLALAEIGVSEACLPEVAANPRLTQLSDPAPW